MPRSVKFKRIIGCIKQAYTGVEFDIPKARALVEHIEKEMAAIKAEVDPMLPPRGLKTAEQSFYKIPCKTF